MTSLVIEIGVILIAATILAYVARLFKQPLLIGYLIAGVILGPVGLGFVTDLETITTLAEIGIAFLLFIVGLELDFRKIKDLGVTAGLVGLGQVVFTFVISFFVSRAFGFDVLTAIYFSIALTLSSTVLVIKVLADRKELATVHGRIALGILLVQDFIAIIALSIFSGLTTFSPVLIGALLLKGAAFFFLTLLVGKYVMEFVFKEVAKSQELLFLTAVSWLFLLVGVSVYLNLSIAVGAFLAGITLASLPYNVEIIGKTLSLRDFFTTLFFVALGMEITTGALTTLIKPIIFFTLFVIIGNVLVVMTVMAVMGFKSKVSFATGTAVSQISEFSLILVTTGFAMGHVSRDILSLVAILAVTTFTVSSYTITYNRELYRFFKPVLKHFDKLSRKHKSLDSVPDLYHPEVILFGKNRLGFDILRGVKQQKKDVLVIDFNPELVERLRKQNIPVMYGDMGDPETIDAINFKKTELVISTVPEVNQNKLLIKKVKRKNRTALIFVTATDIYEALALYEAGAHYVILPHFLGGERVSYMLRDVFKKKPSITQLRREHIKSLRHRRKLGH